MMPPVIILVSNAGAAYVYERSGGTWNLAQKLTASDRAVEDYFGFSVSVYGDYALVGAYWEDHDTAGNNALPDAGSAYIFERNSNGIWTEVQKLTAPNRAAQDYFWFSVSLSGNHALIGAYVEDENADDNQSTCIMPDRLIYLSATAMADGSLHKAGCQRPPGQ